MLLSATIYAAAVELGDDRMSLREVIIASCVGVPEVPVKVQISCNLELVA